MEIRNKTFQHGEKIEIPKEDIIETNIIADNTISVWYISYDDDDIWEGNTDLRTELEER